MTVDMRLYYLYYDCLTWFRTSGFNIDELHVHLKELQLLAEMHEKGDKCLELTRAVKAVRRGCGSEKQETR